MTDVDGRTFLDFAGGIACQNTGHGFAPVVAAVHDAGRPVPAPVLHGRDVRALRRGLPPPGRAVAVRRGEQRSILVNSGAEAIENAVKIARVATGRPAVIVFDNAFHGRTLLTMTMTSKVKPYKAGFGPFAPEVYRTPAPYPYRGITTRTTRSRRSSTSSRATSTPHRSRASCSSRCRAKAASSRCRADFPPACRSSAGSTGSSTSTTRFSPASGGRGRCGRSSTTRASSRTCSSPGSRSAAACRSPASPGAPS